ncbi:GntR family transcriptional regulator [Roseibium aquae]|uniref:GntR family transcriptional regulator n=1 Tax=Roseibium aquae TaxID=1323746 RepID=A0A916X162_9HYPH|nr:GntR family transcriptional regulator [Roseibium aquae]GGB53690.1 GntR family transcriptional regulator [Roseibium aquae]
MTQADPQDDTRLEEALSGVEIDRSAAIAPQLYRILRERIIDNRLPPGASVNESDVSRMCAVSRTPLRAAMQQLAAEGLIVTRPQVGSVVARVDEAQILEAVLIRAALEAAVVRRLCETGIDETLIAGNLAMQQRAAEADDYATFFKLDEGFHHMLSDMADMPRAWRLAQSVKAHVDRQRLALMSSIPGRSLAAFKNHMAILDRIRAGDALGAACEMDAHVRSVLMGKDALGTAASPMREGKGERSRAN